MKKYTLILQVLTGHIKNNCCTEVDPRIFSIKCMIFNELVTHLITHLCI